MAYTEHDARGDPRNLTRSSRLARGMSVSNDEEDEGVGSRRRSASDSFNLKVPDTLQDQDDRQDTLSLVDIARSGRGPIISRKNEMVVYTGRPICSNTTCSRRAELDDRALNAKQKRTPCYCGQSIYP